MREQYLTLKKNECVHHWFINDRLIGCCIKCGATKDFGKALRLPWAEKPAGEKKVRRRRVKQG